MGEGDYSIDETAFWSERVYSHVFRLLNEYGVMLEGILLKPNMCLPGVFCVLWGEGGVCMMCMGCVHDTCVGVCWGYGVHDVFVSRARVLYV